MLLGQIMSPTWAIFESLAVLWLVPAVIDGRQESSIVTHGWHCEPLAGVYAS